MSKQPNSFEEKKHLLVNIYTTKKEKKVKEETQSEINFLYIQNDKSAEKDETVY